MQKYVSNSVDLHFFLSLSLINFVIRSRWTGSMDRKPFSEVSLLVCSPPQPIIIVVLKL